MSDAENISRRAFVGASMTALGAASLNVYSKDANGSIFYPTTSLTVQEVINLVIKDVPNAPFKDTVDTLKSGSPDQIVTGIVTTMFATISVIERAIALKANFIIAHEPTFYNHFDTTENIESDPVYQFKRDLLKKHTIAVWRCHDYLHSFEPDGVQRGVLQTVGWEQNADPQNPHLVKLQPTTLQKIALHLKEKIGASYVRVIGSLDRSCSSVVLMPGAAGGKSQIAAVQALNPDVLVCGEISEWETAEYIRDSTAAGISRSLIILGHAQSEEPGMKWMAAWLSPKIPSLKVTHVPANDPFTWV